MGKKTVGRTVRSRVRAMSYAGIFVALAVGVMTPVLLSTTVGILTLVVGEGSKAVLAGVLIICFTTAAVGAAIAVVVLVEQRARTARMQADLMASVSHELRTPLSAIRMYAQTLLSKKPRPSAKRAREALSAIVGQTEWLDAGIEQILVWRRATKDREMLELRPAPLRDTIEQAVRRFRGMIPPRSAKLTVHLRTRVLVEHDSHAIGTLVLNLLVNAYKYTGEEKRIAMEGYDDGHDAVVTVEDNGIGVPPHIRKRIFQPFFRGDTRLRGSGEGVGLGLAIVSHVARAHGGSVSVESEVGRFSRFTVRLPAVPAERTPG